MFADLIGQSVFEDLYTRAENDVVLKFNISEKDQLLNFLDYYRTPYDKVLNEINNKRDKRFAQLAILPIVKMIGSGLSTIFSIYKFADSQYTKIQTKNAIKEIK